MGQAVIAYPVSLGMRPFGPCPAPGIGKLAADYEECRVDAFGAKHVENMIGDFGFGTVIEGERHFHLSSPLDSRPAVLAYFFWSMGAPQHLSAPVPALVTITCEPHLPQM